MNPKTPDEVAAEIAAETYVHQEYPKWVKGARGADVLVQNAEEEAAIGEHAERAAKEDAIAAERKVVEDRVREEKEARIRRAIEAEVDAEIEKAQKEAEAAAAKADGGKKK